MRNFKKIALGLVVMLMAFGFSAFKATEKVEGTRISYFFEYTPGLGGEADRNNWMHVSSNTTSCDGNNGGCVIEVDADYTQPGTSGLELKQDVTLVGSTNNPDVDGIIILDAFNKN